VLSGLVVESAEVVPAGPLNRAPVGAESGEPTMIVQSPAVVTAQKTAVLQLRTGLVGSV
jgi:hypothetical protein